jgi:peptidoglycan/xylan/chitin deacetylase (PgdA/CDA1 family)
LTSSHGGAVLIGSSRAVAAAIGLLSLAALSTGANDGSRAVARLAALGQPLVCGGARGRDVALTFDDGPGPYTARVLRLLDRAGARATFFLVGKELARWPGMPAWERRFGALGDHTWTHVMLTAVDSATARRELEATKRALEQKTHVPVQLFRPPYGAHDRRIDELARSLGLLEVLWSIDSRDSEGAPWYQIAANVERRLHPGSIVLMHENRGQTVRALNERILPYLRAHNLYAVSIPELLRVDPPSRKLLAAGLAGCLRLAASRQ